MRVQLSVFKYRLTKNGFSGPKTFQGFRETGVSIENSDRLILVLASSAFLSISLLHLSVEELSAIKFPRGSYQIGFGRLCPKKKHIMLLAVLICFRNYAKIMLLSENYALCHRNYAT